MRSQVTHERCERRDSQVRHTRVTSWRDRASNFELPATPWHAAGALTRSGSHRLWR